MRVTVLILSFLFSFSSYSQSDVVSVQEKNTQISTSNATIDFESKVVDYGTIIMAQMETGNLHLQTMEVNP